MIEILKTLGLVLLGLEPCCRERSRKEPDTDGHDQQQGRPGISSRSSGHLPRSKSGDESTAGGGHTFGGGPEKGNDSQGENRACEQPEGGGNKQ